MGVLDISAKVAVAYKADISDMKAKLKELEGAEKALAEQQIKTAEARNKSIDGGVKSLAELGLAINAASSIMSGLMETQAAASEHARLSYAAQGVDIDKLKVASHGLATETELLGDASKFNNGMIAMTSDQMGVAEKAIVSFTRKGFEHAKAHEAILKAVTTLKVDGLDDLGIHIDKSGLSMDSGKDRAILYKRVMDGLAKSSLDVKDGEDLKSEAFEKSGVSLKDSFDKMKVAIGELAESMAPLLEGLAKAVSLVAELVKSAKDYAKKNPLGFVMAFTGGGAGQVVGEQLDAMGNAGMMTGKNFARGLASGLTGVDPLGNEAPDGDVAGYVGGKYSSTAPLNHGESVIDLGKGKDAGGGLSADQQKKLDDAAKALASATLKSVTDDLVKQLEDEQTKLAEEYGPAFVNRYGELTDSMAVRQFSNGSSTSNAALKGLNGVDKYGARGGFDSDVDKSLKQFYGKGGEESRRDAIYEKGKNQEYSNYQEQSFLEKTFGKKEEFEAYQELFQGLTGTITAAYGAWVSGSMSGGQAAKLFLKQTLEALGSRMAVRGIEELAEGVASLALGPIGGVSAAAHFASAALFGAGAVAAGVASKSIGGASAHGGGGGGGGSAPAPNVSGGSSGNSNAPTGPVIVVGDSFADDSPRMRQVRAKALVAKALGGGGVSDE